MDKEEKNRELPLPLQDLSIEESPENEEAAEEVGGEDTTHTIVGHEIRVRGPIRYIVNTPRGLNVLFDYNDIMEICPELVREYNSHYPELERELARRL